MQCTKTFRTAGLVLSAALLGTVAQAGIIPIGSSLTFGGTNSPDTYSTTTTFGPTPVLVDNGRVRIWEDQTPTGPNGEWDVFHMETVDGGPLAGDINAYWSVVMDYELSAPVYFDAVALQWAVNGTPVSPLFNFGGICCATSSNPILPGDAYYNSGFQAPLNAGTQTNWLQVFVSPYSFVSAGGIDPNTANQLNFALHFTLQNPTAVPEPSTLLLLSPGLAGLMFRRRRQSRV